MSDLPIHRALSSASPIVYGCMGLGGPWDTGDITRADVDTARRCIEAALAAGITVFDHADIYSLGKAESAFGAALAESPGLRERMIIQSKCGIRFADAQGTKRYDLSPEWIMASVDGSLQRLGIEQLDILMLHRPDPLMAPDAIAEAFSRLQAQGKVAHFGVSNMNAPQIALLQRAIAQPLVVNQMEMSLLARDAFEEEVLAGHRGGASVNFGPGLIEQGVAGEIQLQAWGSLAGGWLSGRDLSGAMPTRQRLAGRVAELARGYDTSREAIVLAWLMRHPARIQPVIGTTDPARIAACGQAADITLSREDWYALWETARGQELP